MSRSDGQYERQITSGRWRPDEPFLSTDGLKITMRRAAGLTPGDVLRVPLRFQAPVLGEFSRPARHGWSTFDTISAGQRSRPSGSQLAEVQIDTMLMDSVVANASTGVVVWDGVENPANMLYELEHIAAVHRKTGRPAPFVLTINQPAVWKHPLVNMVAVLTSLEATQRPGEIGTEYVSMTFLEYAELEVGDQRRHEKPAKRHKLDLDRPGVDDSGDSLHKLAVRYLHRASAWKEIAKVNGIKGVSPGSESELAAWCRRHHKTSLIIPRVELRVRGFEATGSSVGGGIR